MEFHAETEIAATCDRVWEILTDAAALVAGGTGVVRLDGTIAKGARIVLESSAAPGQKFRLKVAEVDAPSRMVWQGGMPFGLFTGRRTFRLTDTDGGCHFAMTERFTGPLAGLIARSIPDLTSSFQTFVAAVKRMAEET